MRRKVISIILAIALTVLILPGCAVPETELIKCQAVISEQAAQITEMASKVAELASQVPYLNAIIEAKDAQISELETQIIALNSTLETADTAKIEVTFLPNPVPCKNDHWHWRVVLTEVNGVGVKLEKVIEQFHSKSGSVNSITNEGDAWFERWIKDLYLPAYGAADFGAGFPCQSIDYVVFIVYGVDDNGHKIDSMGRVDFEGF